MSYAPVILFVYKRPEHTRLTVEALQRNVLASETDLYIFSDAAKQPSDEHDVKIVRHYIHNINGFRNVVITERSANWGLANSVINGVTEIIVKRDHVIVLEDDIITSSTFLTFMNECLNFYQDDFRIGSVTGYSLPIELSPDYPWSVYSTHRHSSWGWGTYQRVWKDVDWEVFDYNSFRRDRSARRAFNVAGPDMAAMLDSQMAGNMDSWSIRFDYNCFKKSLLSLAPVNNLVKNVGFDGSGVHCGTGSNRLESLLMEANKDKPFVFPVHPELDQCVVSATRKLFTASLATRLKRLLKSFI
jgi:hypothetical protein